MYDESAPRGASENRSGGRVRYDNSTVDCFLAGELHAHELPWDLWLLWADGFHAGAARVTTTKLARVEREADALYDLAYNGDKARKRHADLLKHFDVVQARKKAGVA
ncbi:hypothetical protein HF576_16415 [Microbacterium sp. CFH 90308]|uniref:Uncharacterized protein n=1 Tax=Microbacterium salsuginis TaxID=2722803 RepID=A0ABX1KG43_9MICO|nr:hypothetical protein [Microbacterium sp. CFH 90308]NLP85432.1 hypothetical protein [Microbacterium sp. CFH 90308]